MKLRSWGTVIAGFVFIGINALLIGKGQQNAEFNNITLMSLLSLDVTVVVSVYIVQYLIERRRKYEYVARLLDNVAKDLRNMDLFNHGKSKEAALLQRYTANKIWHIHNAVPAKVKRDTQYVVDNFEEMQRYYGEHPNAPKDDITYERKRIDLLSKLVKIQLRLYDFDVKEKEKTGNVN